MQEPLDPFAELMLDEAAVLAASKPKIDPEELRRLWAEGLTVRQLADHFGSTEAAVEWRAVRLGLKSPKPGVDWAVARQRWAEGKTLREIANELNASPDHVATILGKPEEDLGPRMRRMQVMTLAQKGLTQAEIGERVGLSMSRVNKILAEAGSHGQAAIAARRSQVLELHDAGMTPTEIAEHTGYNRRHVRAILEDYGLEPHSRPGTRPTEAEALRRREMVWDLDDEGVPVKDIAERTGLSLRHVHHIIEHKPDQDMRAGQKLLREMARKAGVSVEFVGDYLRMNEHERRRFKETGIMEHGTAWTEEDWRFVEEEIRRRREQGEAELRRRIEEDMRELEAETRALESSSPRNPTAEPTAEEMARARTFWEKTQERAARGEPFAILLRGAMERRYPQDTEHQVRFAGYMGELMDQYPEGRFPAGEARELAKKWGVQEITKFVDILP